MNTIAIDKPREQKYSVVKQQSTDHLIVKRTENFPRNNL